MLADERPENELHEQRAAEMLTLVAMVYGQTRGELGDGFLPECPVCKRGIVAYTVTRRDNGRRGLSARCSTSGCIRFETATTTRRDDR